MMTVKAMMMLMVMMTVVVRVHAFESHTNTLQTGPSRGTLPVLLTD